jgi:hypothetical protein
MPAHRGVIDRSRDPALFGNPYVRGIGEVAQGLVRDVAVLTGAAMLPWDVWGAMPNANDDNSEETLALFDYIALLPAGPVDIDQLGALCGSNSQLLRPTTVFNTQL